MASGRLPASAVLLPPHWEVQTEIADVTAACLLFFLILILNEHLCCCWSVRHTGRFKSSVVKHHLSIMLLRIRSNSWFNVLLKDALTQGPWGLMDYLLCHRCPKGEIK